MSRIIYWHFAYRLTDAGPEPFMCSCLEPEHDDLMQWIGNYPDDHEPAPHELPPEAAA